MQVRYHRLLGSLGARSWAPPLPASDTALFGTDE
jgi:hypothetical protein